MNKPAVKRVAFTIFSGLLIGLLIPPAEFAAVFYADYEFSCLRQYFINDGYMMGDPWLSIIFVGVEIITLYLIARCNKTLATAALITATASTVVLLEIVSHIPDLP